MSSTNVPAGLVATFPSGGKKGYRYFQDAQGHLYGAAEGKEVVLLAHRGKWTGTAAPTPAPAPVTEPAPDSAPAQHSEAPASATVKVTLRGYEVLFTLRDTSGGALLGKLDNALTHLEAMGATPAPTRGGGKPSGPRVSVPANGSAPLCPRHGQPMRPSNYGGFFCGHKDANGTYCNAKAKA